MFGYGRYDPFGYGDMSIYDDMGGINRGGFAPVSERAKVAKQQAEYIFLKHLATVDVSTGPVTTEIIQFHLVPDMKKAFNKFVKEYGCTASSRKLTRAEQDKINKTRKSLMSYTSVKVTPEAQKAYLDKNAAAASSSGSKTSSTAVPTKSPAATKVPASSSTSSKVNVAQASKRGAEEAGLGGDGEKDGQKRAKGQKA